MIKERYLSMNLNTKNYLKKKHKNLYINQAIYFLTSKISKNPQNTFTIHLLTTSNQI